MSDIDKRLDSLVHWILHEPAYTPTQMKDKIKQLMVDELEKMIGDMEYRETEDMSLGSWSNKDYKAFGRNELRIELRKKLEEFRK